MLSKCNCKLILEFSYTLVNNGCIFGMKYYEKSNAGIVSLASKASSISIIYIKSYYSTVSRGGIKKIRKRGPSLSPSSPGPPPNENVTSQDLQQ